MSGGRLCINVASCQPFRTLRARIDVFLTLLPSASRLYVRNLWTLFRRFTYPHSYAGGWRETQKRLIRSDITCSRGHKEWHMTDFIVYLVFFPPFIYAYAFTYMFSYDFDLIFFRQTVLVQLNEMKNNIEQKNNQHAGPPTPLHSSAISRVHLNTP